MEPTIICPWDYKGAHNEGIKVAENKLAKAAYKDFSIVMVTPTRSVSSGISPKWVSSMLSLMKPMNQKCAGPVFICGMEVGDAYNTAIHTIKNHSDLKGFKFMLTWEDDVLPSPDALLEMLQVQLETDADIVSSLYWSKGEAGFPMIYGNVDDPEINFRPIHPTKEPYKWCYGSGMGFTLFKMDQFDKYFPGQTEWFTTQAEYREKEGKVLQATQDLFYMERLVRAGGKICVAQYAKAAHYDAGNDVMW